ncbi:MAG: right-handed parallel beta-helix repeat-containing protein [Candidatus Thermoplasmatota archaeon]|nr:right-handed parallel beta-helix repeat-containing protein [Candidatus Thermoplasmatota archaeon]
MYFYINSKGAIHLLKKAIILGSIFFFVACILCSSVGIGYLSCINSKTWDGTILYVGGDGSNNFTTIQEALFYAHHGDTVFVYDESSPYYEHVLIDKSVHLIGENKTTTIIDGENTGDVIVLSADNVSLHGFTIQNSGDAPKADAGIESQSKGCIISGNRIIQNGRYAIGIFLNGSSESLITGNFISENGNEGIFLQRATDCIIQGNEFTQNGHCAIVVSMSSNTTIVQNTIENNYAGISIWPGSLGTEISWNLIKDQEYSGVGLWSGADSNHVHHNYFSNNSLYGCIITRAHHNVIAHNTILGSNEGVYLDMANMTVIQCNNFIENNYSAFFKNSSFNRWKQNYWDGHQGRWPKCIWGVMRIPWNKSIIVRWVNFDWFPSRTPYEIPLLRGEKE